MNGVTFAIGEVAAMLGLSAHTIRAWERRHLAAQPMRTPSGQRRYTQDDVELLRQIKYERHVHGLSMRLATMTAQGVIAPDTNGAEAQDGTGGAGEPGGDPVRMVADLIPELVVVVDAAGRIRHANTAFVRFSDALPSWLRGRSLVDFVDPFDRAKAVQAYQEPLRTRRGWELGLRTERRRGLFSFDCWPVPAPDGPVLVLVGRPLDPAAPLRELPGPPDPGRRESADEVRGLLDGVADVARSLELLRPWLETTPLGVVVTGIDPDMTALAANETFQRLLPPGALPIEGRPWRDLAPRADPGRLAATAREVVVSGRSRSLAGLRPVWDDRPSGPPAVWNVELDPVTDMGGAVTHLLLSVRDASLAVATARRHEALVGASAELRRAVDARQVLAAAARHARGLLPNDGSLVATIAGRDQGGIGVVAAEGVWTHAAERDLRLALVRDVARRGASVEIERDGPGEASETMRVVPVVPPVMAAGRRRVQGVLAFCRLGGGPFAPEDRLQIDEFAARIGAALGRAGGLGPDAAIGA